MAFQLIPFPISILFSCVFAIAVIYVAWKLRKKGRFFQMLFYAILIITVFLFAGIVSTIALSPAHAPTVPKGPVKIEITTDKSSYVLGQEVQILVYVNNTNDFTVSTPSRLILTVGNGHYGGPNQIFNLGPASVFAAHSETLLKTIPWIPTTQENNKYAFWYTPGNWIVTVYFDNSANFAQSAQCNITLTAAQNQ